MDWKIVVTGLFLLASSFSWADLPNATCDFEFWNGSTFTCVNGQGSVSIDPALSSEFSNWRQTNLTRFGSGGQYDVYFGVPLEGFAIRDVFNWANVTVQEPTFGWVSKSFFFENVTGFVNLSGNAAPCEIGLNNSRNPHKFNVSNYNGTRFSRVACFKTIQNASPNYTVNWDAWGVNGSVGVESERWVRVNDVQTFEYEGLKWYYKLGVSFADNGTLRLLVHDEATPAKFVNVKYSVFVKPSGESLADALANGHYFFSDPWTYVDYAYEIEWWFNNTANVKKVNELVVPNMSNWSQYCLTTGCYDVRVAVFDDSGVWRGQTVFNASQNYTNETDVVGRYPILPTQPSYWVAPANGSPLYVASTVNLSANNYSLALKVYVGASGVTDWGTNTVLYGTSFCDASAYGGTWVNTVTGSYSACSFTSTDTDVNDENYLPIGYSGGALTITANNSGASDDPLWLDTALSGTSLTRQLAAHTSIAANNQLFYRDGAGYNTLDTGNATPSKNATYLLSYYPNGTTGIYGYYLDNSSINASILSNLYLQGSSNGSNLGTRIGFNLYGNANTVKELCYLYWAFDAGAAGYSGVPREYCRTYLGSFGASLIEVGNVTHSSAPSISANATNPASGTNWTSSLTVRFNVTANGTQAISAATLEWNATTNYSMTLVAGNSTNGTWEYNLTGQAAGAWEYQFFVNVSGNYTNSTPFTFTIAKTDPLNRLWLNTMEANNSIPSDQIANATASVTGDCAQSLLKDGVPVANPFEQLVSAGLYNFTASCAATANYSASETTYYLQVTGGGGGGGGTGGGGGGGSSTTTTIIKTASPTPLLPSQMASNFSTSFYLVFVVFLAVGYLIYAQRGKILK